MTAPTEPATVASPTAVASPLPDGMTPGFYLTARALTHIGDYRRFYAPLAVWLLIMAMVPRTDVGPSFTDPAGVGQSVAAAPASAPIESAIGAALTEPSFGAIVPLDTFGGDFAAPFGAGPSSGGSESAFGGGSDDDRSFDDEDDPGFDEEPPPPDDTSEPPFTIPPPPPLPLPRPPAELEPLLRVVSPLANQACSPIGLAGVVIAVAGPAVDPVPATQLAPYLSPLYVACAQFPQFGPRTVCEIDRAYGQDVTGGLLPPPAVIGIGIDTIEQLEKVPGSGYSPGQAAALREQLGCTRG